MFNTIQFNKVNKVNMLIHCIQPTQMKQFTPVRLLNQKPKQNQNKTKQKK